MSLCTSTPRAAPNHAHVRLALCGESVHAFHFGKLAISRLRYPRMKRMAAWPCDVIMERGPPDRLGHTPPGHTPGPASLTSHVTTERGSLAVLHAPVKVSQSLHIGTALSTVRSLLPAVARSSSHLRPPDLLRTSARGHHLRAPMHPASSRPRRFVSRLPHACCCFLGLPALGLLFRRDWLRPPHSACRRCRTLHLSNVLRTCPCAFPSSGPL